MPRKNEAPAGEVDPGEWFKRVAEGEIHLQAAQQAETYGQRHLSNPDWHSMALEILSV
jgi:hypothetical protein